jgi:choline dehydrogenase
MRLTIMPEREFDYLIVGGGSSGCVLANRLSENQNIRVCLIEAGPSDKSWFLKPAISVMYAMKYKKYTSQYFSSPQRSMNGRSIHIPRGKTLGGTSSINGMLYVRGHPSDYDNWAENGNIGWDWQSVLPYFKKSEKNHNFKSSKLHGTDGLLNVRKLDDPNPVNQAYFSSAKQLQFPFNQDFNGIQQEGVGHYQSTMTKGIRNSASAAFLRPVKHRKNLTIMTNIEVESVSLENSQATGIRVSRGNTKFEIKAKKEVLLCAGSIGSPSILMRSGVGSPSTLSKAGINTIHPLPGVGENLQDHASCTIYVKTSSRSPYGISFPVLPKLAAWGFDYFLRRRGLFASNIMECGGFFKTEKSLQHPNIQHIFMPAFRQPPPNMLAYGHGYSLNTILLRPKSTGSVKIKSPNPSEAPIIDLNMLDAAEDLEALVAAIKTSRQILSSREFSHLKPKEFRPGPQVQTDEDWKEYIRANAQTVYHPVGTCKMGVGEDAVVDSNLSVRGLRNLRVIDASIMPRIVGGNTNAPTIMIAEKGADIIKKTLTH